MQFKLKKKGHVMDLERQAREIRKRLEYYYNLPNTRLPEYRRLKARIVPKLQRALQKIWSGTYTQCDTCGEQIEPDRLTAVPAALLCLQCQQAADKNSKA